MTASSATANGAIPNLAEAGLTNAKVNRETAAAIFRTCVTEMALRRRIAPIIKRATLQFVPPDTPRWSRTNGGIAPVVPAYRTNPANRGSARLISGMQIMSSSPANSASI
jgi:hypothetical protein